ncbi:MAG: (2Fe-2S)-binding protein [Bacillota bacterium]|uniref:(2Fe-2S)-binding protein n=1 Tax=Thermanaerosceptrum fracticalcis TaxID=1712410 RepID=A0A7G6DYL1_THEFR|nr:(2Fe-2S)-binding protein [Thermanaerosceptrum fracticalcis]QNB44915.1 (2Fe-2S)-binding protein [Thermanaerosceptrum fracticalcis]
MSDATDKVYICRCEEVTKEEIEQAIREGATTLTGIKKRTHAGMGLCQGRTCRKLISGMLAGKKEPAEIIPPTSRPPVRTAKISEFVEEDEV